MSPSTLGFLLLNCVIWLQHKLNVLFQNMAILLSSSEPLRISQVSYIDSVDDYSSPWLINALKHLILHYRNTSKEIEKIKLDANLHTRAMHKLGHIKIPDLKD